MSDFLKLPNVSINVEKFRAGSIFPLSSVPFQKYISLQTEFQIDYFQKY